MHVSEKEPKKYEGRGREIINTFKAHIVKTKYLYHQLFFLCLLLCNCRQRLNGHKIFSKIQTNSILIRALNSVLSTFISSVLGASKPSFVWLFGLSVCQNFLQMCKIFHK